LNIDTPILVSTPEFQLIHLKSLSQHDLYIYILTSDTHYCRFYLTNNWSQIGLRSHGFGNNSCLSVE